MLFFNKNELLCVNANDSEFTIELDGIEFKTNGESIDSEIFLEKEKDFTIYDHFDYISADRFGPKRYHEEIVLPYNMIGKYGENTINMLTKYYDKIYNNLEKSLSFIFNEKINTYDFSDLLFFFKFKTNISFFEKFFLCL